ncbi:killer toxin resistant protein [Microbotryomycetes sp. JL221]|nr:killer toxin resistant protein [Microbotryomycetes sp. JL221]
MDAPFDVLYPQERDKSLPFFALYASSSDPAFPALYNLLYPLAEPYNSPSRLQFSVRWISDPRSPSAPLSVAFAEATLHLSEDSVSETLEKDLQTHILASQNPLKTMTDLAQNLPLVAPQLADFQPESPKELEAAVAATKLPSTFAINGNFMRTVTPGAVVKELHAERKIVGDLASTSKRFGYANARDILMAAQQQPAESIKGRGSTNVIKATPENPLRIVNLVDALRDMPEPFVRESFIEADPGGEDPVSSVTIFLVTDLNSKQGREYAQEALKFIQPYNNVRVSLVHNPDEVKRTQHPYELSDLVCLMTIAKTFPQIMPHELLTWIKLDVGAEGPNLAEGHPYVSSNPMTAFVKKGMTPEQQDFAVTWWRIISGFVKQTGLRPGSSGLVINGRVVNFLKRPFTSGNYQLIVEHERTQRIEPIADAVLATSEWEHFADRQELAHIIHLACSVVSAQSLPEGKPSRTRASREIPVDYPRFTAGASSKDALIEIAVVVDPAHREARQWMPIVNGLAQLSSIRVEVYLAPTIKRRAKVPATIYSRGFPIRLSFDSAGDDEAPAVEFNEVPGDVEIARLDVKLHTTGEFELVEGVDVAGKRIGELPEAAEAVYLFTFRDADEMPQESAEEDDEEEESTPTPEPRFHFGLRDEL